MHQLTKLHGFNHTGSHITVLSEDPTKFKHGTPYNPRRVTKHKIQEKRVFLILCYSPA